MEWVGRLLPFTAAKPTFCGTFPVTATGRPLYLLPGPKPTPLIMSPPPSPMPAGRETAMSFVRERIGPSSSAWLATEAGSAALDARLQKEARPEDAALGALFERVRHDRAVSDEFLGYFLHRILGVRIVELYPGLRRMLDTGDLAHSVMADLLPGITELRFTTEAGFLSFLVQRMRWKASDRVRSPRARTERPAGEEEQFSPVSLTPETSEALRGLVAEEERTALLIAVHRLPERDRAILLRYLEGMDRDRAAAELDLTPAAYRKALQRAIAKAREILH